MNQITMSLDRYDDMKDELAKQIVKTNEYARENKILQEEKEMQNDLKLKLALEVILNKYDLSYFKLKDEKLVHKYTWTQTYLNEITTKYGLPEHYLEDELIRLLGEEE